jgi:hypothetical protein
MFVQGLGAAVRSDFSNVLGCALILALALLGCRNRGGRVHQIGETAAQSDYKFTIHQTKDCELAEADKRLLDRAKKGSKALGLEVTLEPTGKDMSYVPYRAVVSDSSGASYPGAVMLLCQPEILPKAQTLTKNRPYRGWITFHVPATATGLKLTYQPFAIEEQTVQFDLGR